MKRLTVTALALATMTGSAALAEQHTNDTENTTETQSGDMQSSDMQSGDMNGSADLSTMQGELIRTRDITGGTIYTFNEAQDEGWDPDYTYDAVGGDWNQIGEIEDLILDQSGQLVGIVAEVGGFLDIADKHVLISVDNVNLVAADEYSYVTNLNEEDLESMEGIDEGWWQ